MDERTPDPPAGDETPSKRFITPSGEEGPAGNQEFFLILARYGKDVWNAWREADRETTVIFDGTDFRQPQNEKIDFSEFIFGNGASFRACRFQEEAQFSWSSFGDDANFRDAVFGSVDFTGATFGSSAEFSDAKFCGSTYFANSTFGTGANFVRAVFENVLRFDNAILSGASNISGTVFKSSAFFSGVRFGGWTLFMGAHFHDVAYFEAKSQDYPSFTMTGLPAGKQALLAERSNQIGRLGRIYFRGARFEQTASFSGQTFDSEIDIVNATFDQPPVFDNCMGVQYLDFYGSRIGFSGNTSKRMVSSISTPGWTSSSVAGLRLRALRKLAEDTKNHDLERDLYIEERKAERGILLVRLLQTASDEEGWPRYVWTGVFKPRFIAHGLWIVAMAVYSVLADYGRSFLRPLVALLVSVPLLWWAYAAVLIPPSTPAKLADFHRATWAFAISNAVPFVGALTLERDVKLTLLCGDRPIDLQQSRQMNDAPVCVPIPGRRFQLLALGQSIFSALCIFFAGLALRNYFKLR